MRWVLAVSAVFGAVAVTAVFVAWQVSPPDGSVVVDGDARETSPTPPAAPPSAGPTVPATTREAVRDAQSAGDEPIRGRYRRRVRVVDPDGRPVAGARVTTDAGTTVTDPRGETEASSSTPFNWIQASRDGLYAEHGNMSFEWQRVHTLRLSEERALRIRTIDHRSRSVGGVPVSLRWVGSSDGEIMDSWHGITAEPDGEAVCGMADSLPLRHFAQEALVALPFFAEEPVEVTSLDVARGRVTLRLPPGAPLEARLLLPDGRPFEGESIVWLRDADGSPDGDVERFDADGATWCAPWVPLSRRWSVSAVPADDTFAPATAVVDGPVRSGVPVTVELRFGPRRSIDAVAGHDRIEARLTDPAGTPVADAWLRVRREADGSSSTLAVRSDGAGRITLPARPYVAPDAPARLTIGLLAAPPTPEAHAAGPTAVRPAHDSERSIARATAVRATATVDVTGLLVPGGGDVGDVVLRAPPVAATGVVVGPDGRPVEGAAVVLDRGRGAPVADAAFTGADGRFELRADPDVEGLELGVTHPRFHPARRPCAPPCLGLEVALDAAAGLAGRLDLGGIPPSALEVAVVQGRRTKLPVALDADGSFEVWGLRAGRCALYVLLPGNVSPAVRVAGIDLEAGRLTRDPRLALVDVGARFERLTVTVLDEEDAPLQGAEVVASGPGGARTFRTGADGRALLLAETLPVDLLATHGHPHGSSYRLVERAGVEEDVTLTAVLQPPVYGK